MQLAVPCRYKLTNTRISVKHELRFTCNTLHVGCIEALLPGLQVAPFVEEGWDGAADRELVGVGVLAAGLGGVQGLHPHLKVLVGIQLLPIIICQGWSIWLGCLPLLGGCRLLGLQEHRRHFQMVKWASNRLTHCQSPSAKLSLQSSWPAQICRVNHSRLAHGDRPLGSLLMGMPAWLFFLDAL